MCMVAWGERTALLPPETVARSSAVPGAAGSVTSPGPGRRVRPAAPKRGEPCDLEGAKGVPRNGGLK